jgi:hypothetical protein
VLFGDLPFAFAFLFLSTHAVLFLHTGEIAAAVTAAIAPLQAELEQVKEQLKRKRDVSPELDRVFLKVYYLALIHAVLSR